MDKEKSTRLLLRQLKDIQAQADGILNGRDSDTEIETFARYAVDLKKYILENDSPFEAKLQLSELPDVDYSRPKIRIWQYVVFPIWWVALYQDYIQKQKALEDIRIVKGKYASIELIVKEHA